MIRKTFPVGVLQCNCTVLGDEATHEAVVIDPGDDIPHILALLKKYGLTLKQIVVTHAHIDHIAGAQELKRLTGARVLYHEADLPQLKIMDVQVTWIGQSTPPEVAPPDEHAAEGLKVGAGNIVGEVMHTPGHTEGSICLYFAPEKLLLAGDTLFAGGIGRTDFPGGNGRKIMESLRDRLMVLPEETRVVPGHGPETTIATERESNPFLG